MPISEPITVTREMECSEWPGMNHMFNLESKLHGLTVKNSLNKMAALILAEDVNLKKKQTKSKTMRVQFRGKVFIWDQRTATRGTQN